MAQQRAAVRKLDDAGAKASTKKNGTRSSRTRKKSFSFSVKCDLSGTYEVSFEGPMTKPFLTANKFAANGIDNETIEKGYINLMNVSEIDNAGVDIILQLMRKLERAGIRFQLVYSDGQVSSMLESSGVNSYFAKPTWVYA